MDWVIGLRLLDVFPVYFDNVGKLHNVIAV